MQFHTRVLPLFLFFLASIANRPSDFTSAATVPPPVSEDASSLCTDSSAFFQWNAMKRRGCNFLTTKPLLCAKKKFKKFCPMTCAGCRKFKCEDATIPFYLKKTNGDEWTCEKLSQMKPEKMKQKCELPQIFDTCRETCKKCGGPPMTINFDEYEIIDEYGERYYRSDIQLENYYIADSRGEFFSDTGYEYGTISKPNVGFNGWAKPMTMRCPGGSFNLHSLWMTPAWTDGLSVTLEGHASGSMKDSFSTELSSTTVPTEINLKQFDFKEIDTLIISTKKQQEEKFVLHVAVDDIMIDIVSLCSVNKVIDIHFDEGNQGDIEEYHHPDIQMENYWSTQIQYATVSIPNVAFNRYMEPMTMSCPGGSFNLRSLWMTPEYDKDLSVTLEGYVGGSLKHSFDTELPSPTEPTKLEWEQPDFGDIDTLIIKSSPTQVALDEIIVEIISPCTVTNPREANSSVDTGARVATGGPLARRM